MSKLLKQQERKLLNTLEELRRNPGEFQAVIVNLSKLQPENRDKQKLILVAHMFDALTRNNANNALFLMANGDVVFVGQDVSGQQLNSLALKVIGFFANDPIVKMQNRDFAKIYALKERFADFDRAIHRIVADSANANTNNKDAPPEFTPEALAAIIKILPKINVRKILRKQNVYNIKDKNVLFREYFTSTNALKAELRTNINLTSDRWLFAHLTVALDQIVTRFIQNNMTADMVSCNLNLASVQLIDELKNANLIVELNLSDVLTDLPRYYTLPKKKLIDLVDIHTLLGVNIQRLKPDYVKLMWSEELTDELYKEQVKERIALIGADKIILIRCDSSKALMWGQGLGIQYYQGFFLDKNLEKNNG